MTSSDALSQTARDTSSPVEEALLDLIDLVERRLDDGPDETRALRRALAGRHRPQDAVVLSSRFRGGRLCVVRADGAWRAAVETEIASVPGIVVDVREHDLVVLVPDLPRQASRDPLDRVERVIARIHRAAPTAAVGVSTVLEGVAQASRGWDEAVRSVAACRPGRAVFAEQAWFEIAVSRLRDSVRESLAVDGPLSQLDDALRSGADLRQTLVSWLEADGDVRVAAEQLHLHPNTLRYRLRRAAEVTGIDLEDPLQRLVTHLALTS